MRRQISILLADLGLIVVATLCAGAIRDNLEISLERTYQLLPYTGWTVVSGAVVLLAMMCLQATAGAQPPGGRLRQQPRALAARSTAGLAAARSA